MIYTSLFGAYAVFVQMRTGEIDVVAARARIGDVIVRIAQVAAVRHVSTPVDIARSDGLGYVKFWFLELLARHQPLGGRAAFRI